MLDAFATREPRQKCLDDYDLTLREREILRLMADGLLKKEIADQLDLSVHTVSTHLRRVYGKPQVLSNTGAVANSSFLGLRATTLTMKILMARNHRFLRPWQARKWKPLG